MEGRTDGPIRFLIDENVSNSVADLLRERGHEVFLRRELTAQGTPDTILAILTRYDGLAIVSHDKHFKAYRQLLPEHERKRIAAGAGRLQLQIPEAQARRRVEEELAAIEFHFHDCQRRGLPFLMSILKTVVRMDRGQR